MDVSFVLIVSCSAEDDDSGTTTPAVTQQAAPAPTPQVPTPGKSSLSAPENNEVCYEGEEVDDSNSEVTFSWDASSDTDSYDLLITNQETSQSQTESGITSTSKAVTLATDVSYSWKVVSKANDTSDTAESDTWQFYLAGDPDVNYSPFPPELLQPISGSRVTPSNETIELRWNCSDVDGDLARYEVYLDNVDASTLINTVDALTIATSLEVTVENDQIFYWKVKAFDQNGNTTTSEIYSFRTN